MKMPWGKHKGADLEDIDEGYLIWVLEKADYAGPTLKRAICELLDLDPDEYGTNVGAKAGGQNGGPFPTFGSTPPSAPGIEMVVKAWWRRMAMKYHPDRGGSVVAFQTINDAHDNLRELAGLK